jgi:hypothetical protein
MPNAEHCMAMADEAERLAAIVSYARDKARLQQQAESWREMAKTGVAEDAAVCSSVVADATAPRGVIGWLRRRHA